MVFWESLYARSGNRRLEVPGPALLEEARAGMMIVGKVMRSGLRGKKKVKVHLRCMAFTSQCSPRVAYAEFFYVVARTAAICCGQGRDLLSAMARCVSKVAYSNLVVWCRSEATCQQDRVL